VEVTRTGTKTPEPVRVVADFLGDDMNDLVPELEPGSSAAFGPRLPCV
jgi:hypothetical protein